MNGPAAAVLLANCVLIGRKYIALQLYKVLGLGGEEGRRF